MQVAPTQPNNPRECRIAVARALSSLTIVRAIAMRRPCPLSRLPTLLRDTLETIGELHSSEQERLDEN